MVTGDAQGLDKRDKFLPQLKIQLLLRPCDRERGEGGRSLPPDWAPLSSWPGELGPTLDLRVEHQGEVLTAISTPCISSCWGGLLITAPLWVPPRPPLVAL